VLRCSSQVVKWPLRASAESRLPGPRAVERRPPVNNFMLFAPVTLTLIYKVWTWPRYSEHRPTKNKVLGQSFQKLEHGHDTQTHTHTKRETDRCDRTHYHAAFTVGKYVSFSPGLLLKMVNTRDQHAAVGSLANSRPISQDNEDCQGAWERAMPAWEKYIFTVAYCLYAAVGARSVHRRSIWLLVSSRQTRASRLDAVGLTVLFYRSIRAVLSINDKQLLYLKLQRPWLAGSVLHISAEIYGESLLHALTQPRPPQLLRYSPVGNRNDSLT